MKHRTAAALLAAVAVLSAPAFAADPPLLLRVERRTEGDLAKLRDAGIPVVAETRPCLFVIGEASEAERLGSLGYLSRVVDRDPAAWDWWLVGLRPDSDLAAVRAFGTIVLEEENWALVRVPASTRPDALGEAKVFASRLPESPVDAPREASPPAAPGRAAAGAPDPLVQKIVAGVSAADIDAYWQDLVANPPTGTRYSTSQGARDATAYCFDAMSAQHAAAKYQTWSTSHAPNVIGTRDGALHPDNVWIVVGHVDDLPSSGPAPGADDNASGTVNVLESAKAVACWAFRDTMKFLAVTGEEFGLYGSEAYADDAATRGEKIQGVLNMDMIAWAGDGSPSPENLDLDYNAPSQWLAERFADASAAYATGLAVNPLYCPSLNASDHYPFWQKGWSALCGITDNEGYCGAAGNYPYYHTSNDTQANCGDRTFFHNVVKTSVATLAELAGPFKIAFDRASYGCGVPVHVVVGDRDLNANPAVVESASVQVWSTTEPAGETLLLTERGPDSMIFEGTLPTTTAPPATGDGALSVAPGDVVQARYVDALDCDGGVGVPYTATAATDCTAPVISSVGTADVTDVAATVTWTTSEPADGAVLWGPSTPPDQTAADSAAVTAHAVRLTGLQACTLYWYEVRSTDPAGNPAVENNGGRWFHFETEGNFGGTLQPCHQGRVTLDRSVVGCADALGVRLVDMDLNRSTSAVDVATVTVSSTTEPVPEILTLTETGPNTSTFTGSLPVATGAAVGGDGVLQVAGGDLVTATYRDADDGTGAAAVAFATGQTDCSAPAGSAAQVTDLADDAATVRWSTDEPSDSRVEWGGTAALGSVAYDAALVTSHAVTIRPLTECGRTYFRVSSADAYGNRRVLDAAGSPFEFNAHRIPGLWRDTFEASTGWTLEGEWQIGAPQGKGSAPADPGGAFEGSKVLGHDLTGLGAHPGDYEPQKTERAVSPVINASSLVHGQLKFRRWLNVGGGGISYVDVKRGGGWTAVWTSPVSGIGESGWSLQTVDVSLLADGNGAFQFAFRQFGGLSASGNRSGWNVDRLVLKSADAPEFDACGGCGGAPTFAGLARADDVSPCEDTGVRLTWDPAPAWGTGHAGTYAVYRDTSPSFVPSASNRVAAAIAATTWTDASAPNDATLYYVVRAENDETCGGGPANGGAVDTNLVRRSARDEVTQPPPGDVGDSVRVNGVNEAHVRFTWAPTPTAARYRVYRAAGPEGPWTPVAEVAGTLWEDRDDLGTLTSRFYAVRPVDACGRE